MADNDDVTIPADLAKEIVSMLDGAADYANEFAEMRGELPGAKVVRMRAVMLDLERRITAVAAGARRRPA